MDIAVDTAVDNFVDYPRLVHSYEDLGSVLARPSEHRGSWTSAIGTWLVSRETIAATGRDLLHVRLWKLNRPSAVNFESTDAESRGSTGAGKVVDGCCSQAARSTVNLRCAVPNGTALVNRHLWWHKWL